MYLDEMEPHADLGYLFRDGYAVLDWVNYRDIKYFRKLRYVDYGKMQYGECEINAKKLIAGEKLTSDCLVKSLDFEVIDWRNGWYVSQIVSDGNLAMIKLEN